MRRPLLRVLKKVMVRVLLHSHCVILHWAPTMKGIQGGVNEIKGKENCIKCSSVCDQALHEGPSWEDGNAVRNQSTIKEWKK